MVVRRVMVGMVRIIVVVVNNMLVVVVMRKVRRITGDSDSCRSMIEVTH